MNFISVIARKVTEWSGSSWAIVMSVSSVLLWILGGFWFGYGTDYQVIINTGTTIITFIMAFIIQHAQNRDGKAVQIKLDELIYSKDRADNTLINVENLTDEELNQMHNKYVEIAAEHKRRSSS